MASPPFCRLPDGSCANADERLPSRALPTRVLLLDTSHRWPVAKLLFDDGEVRAIVFDDASPLDHCLFAGLPPEHADELRRHVTDSRRRGRATAAPDGRFAVLSAGMDAGPKSYGARVSGNCLAPVYRDGDVIVCDPDRAPTEGDFVAIWWKDATRMPSVKRLAAPVSGRDELVFEQLNPPRAFPAQASDVEAIHKAIGKLRAPGREARS